MNTSVTFFFHLSPPPYFLLLEITAKLLDLECMLVGINEGVIDWKLPLATVRQCLATRNGVPTPERAM